MKTPIRYRTRQAKPTRLFPLLRNCPQEILQAAKWNEEDEISSRELTDWYVEKFCDANHLTK